MKDIQVLANQVVILNSRLEQLTLQYQADRKNDGELIMWMRHRIRVLEDGLNFLASPADFDPDFRAKVAKDALGNQGTLNQELKRYFYEPCREGCPLSVRNFQPESAKVEYEVK